MAFCGVVDDGDMHWKGQWGEREEEEKGADTECWSPFVRRLVFVVGYRECGCGLWSSSSSSGKRRHKSTHVIATATTFYGTDSIDYRAYRGKERRRDQTTG